MSGQDAISQGSLGWASASNGAVVSTDTVEFVPGMRFFRNGHWWEIDGYIKGRNSSYYRCKPACLVESRFYTESEIKQALDKEATTMDTKLQQCAGRGTGRVIPISRHRSSSCTEHSSETCLKQMPKNKLGTTDKEPIKVLLIGSKQAIKRTMQMLHLAGFSELSDWSPFQRRSHSNEFLSILLHKI